MTNVPYIALNDGNSIPQIGLGVWQAENGTETKQAVEAALAAGYRHIDTAAVYRNEESVGEGIRASGIPREDLFITTKLWNSDQGAGNVRAALETSLNKLGLDYIDLYLIHWPTPARDLIVETWKEFEALKAEGLIRSIGVSNFRVEDLERLKSEGLSTPILNQIELHPRLLQKELREYALANDIRIESWSPIGGSRGNILEDDVLKAIATKHAKTPAQIVIRWHIQHGLIVIPKSVRPARIAENFDVFDFELSDEEIQAIDDMGDGERMGPDPATMNNS
jgi:diketogulonate reductase-like aldo/keto reductase